MVTPLSKIDMIIDKLTSCGTEIKSRAKFPCGYCTKNVNTNQKALQCHQCQKWIHIKCNDLTVDEYLIIKDNLSNSKWLCLSCIIINNAKIFPFTFVSNEIILQLNDLPMPSLVDLMPTFEIKSNLQNMPNLYDYDSEESIEININSKYISVQELSNYRSTANDLSVFHSNIASLVLHHDELQTLLYNLHLDFDIIGISEIKANFDSTSINIDIPGYTFFSTPSKSNAGGVGMYVKSDINSRKRTDLCVKTDEFETIWVEILNKSSKNILCCCSYRHPKSDISQFTDHINDIITEPSVENKTVIIMGDFNINLLNYETSPNVNNYINCMFSNHFQPVILHPSRITSNSSTLIDNIFTNAIDCKIFSGNILSQISDHLPQFAIFSNKKPDYSKQSYFSYKYNNFNQERFINDYTTINSTFLRDDNIDINAKFDKFLLNVNKLVNNHCPKEKIGKRALKLKEKPWINRRIMKMMKIRDKLLREYKSSNASTTFLAYKKFRNRVVNEIRSSKKKCFDKYFNDNRSNIKMMWKGIRNIIKLKANNGSNITEINSSEGSRINDPTQIANSFNRYFSNVATDITKKIPLTQKSPIDYLGDPLPNSFFLSSTTPTEVSAIISALKDSKASGPNSIPIKLLKIIGNDALPIISSL